jgi:hypothetical protein
VAKPCRIKLNKPLCLPCKWRWVQLVALRGIGKTARTLSPCRFWHFPSFARGQYQRTAPTRKKRNLSHFLEVSQRVEIYLFFCSLFFLAFSVLSCCFISFCLASSSLAFCSSRRLFSSSRAFASSYIALISS